MMRLLIYDLLTLVGVLLILLLLAGIGLVLLLIVVGAGFGGVAVGFLVVFGHKSRLLCNWYAAILYLNILFYSFFLPQDLNCDKMYCNLLTLS